MLCICAGTEQGAISTGSSRTYIAHPSPRFKTHPRSFSKHLTSFQVSCYKGKCKQSTFRTCSVSQPSIYMFFQTLFLLPDLFHIKRAVNLYHKNRLGKTEWCLPSEFFVVVKNNGLPLSGQTSDSPHTGLLVPICLSLQVSTHQRYGLHLPDAFTWETCYTKAVADPFVLSIKYISFHHLMAWQRDHSSFK